MEERFMVKYFLTAMTLKAFSASALTRKVYRDLGNSLGGKRRATEIMPDYYLDRVNRMLHTARRFGVPGNGTRMVEIGTGWCHWEALTTRLFFDVSGILYDVWDNRQMDALKNYVRHLEKSIDKLDADASQRAAALQMISRIKELSYYEALYKMLGFKYVLDPAGKLDPLEKGSFDFVVSGGVLEHIYARDAREFVSGMSSLLKPGGYSVHSINIRDHLRQYDTTASLKQYLQYSDRTWKRYFSNEVQYINRIQRSEWLEFFSNAGLELVEEVVEPEDISGLRIAPEYARFEDKDLRCGGLHLTHRKPV
jgi:SAM-dependent methyltransferase